MYTMMYMTALRTQIYLTREQRDRLDVLRAQRGVSLAEAIRLAIDEYLDRTGADHVTALSSSFGAMPDLAVPSRDEWDRG